MVPRSQGNQNRFPVDMSTFAEQTVEGREGSLETASRYIHILAQMGQGEEGDQSLQEILLCNMRLIKPSLDPEASHLSSNGPHSHLARSTTS